MTEIEWLLFTAQLPSTPSSLRVSVWRRLRESGATSLQNGVWILPHNEDNIRFIERLLGYISQNQASGQVFFVQGMNEVINKDILTRFEDDREQEYEEFLEQCDKLIAEIEKETQRQKFTFAELEENEQNLKRLRKWIDKIQKRDFIKSEKSQGAIAAYQRCREIVYSYTRQVYIQEGIEIKGGGEILDQEFNLPDQD